MGRWPPLVTPRELVMWDSLLMLGGNAVVWLTDGYHQANSPLQSIGRGGYSLVNTPGRYGPQDSESSQSRCGQPEGAIQAALEWGGRLFMGRISGRKRGGTVPAGSGGKRASIITDGYMVESMLRMVPSEHRDVVIYCAQETPVSLPECIVFTTSCTHAAYSPTEASAHVRKPRIYISCLCLCLRKHQSTSVSIPLFSSAASPFDRLCGC